MSPSRVRSVAGVAWRAGKRVIITVLAGAAVLGAVIAGIALTAARKNGADYWADQGFGTRQECLHDPELRGKDALSYDLAEYPLSERYNSGAVNQQPKMGTEDDVDARFGQAEALREQQLRSLGTQVADSNPCRTSENAFIAASDCALVVKTSGEFPGRPAREKASGGYAVVYGGVDGNESVTVQLRRVVKGSAAAPAQSENYAEGLQSEPVLLAPTELPNGDLSYRIFVFHTRADGSTPTKPDYRENVSFNGRITVNTGEREANGTPTLQATVRENGSSLCRFSPTGTKGYTALGRTRGLI